MLKLKQNGTSGDLLKIIECFLSNRCKKLVANGLASGWVAANSRFPQDSVLDPFFLLVYTNNLSTGLLLNLYLSDGTSLFLFFFVIEIHEWLKMRH